MGCIQEENGMENYVYVESGNTVWDDLISKRS